MDAIPTTSAALAVARLLGASRKVGTAAPGRRRNLTTATATFPWTGVRRPTWVRAGLAAHADPASPVGPYTSRTTPTRPPIAAATLPMTGFLHGLFGSGPAWIRTRDQRIMSPLL